jgi:hypothetical protein
MVMSPKVILLVSVCLNAGLGVAYVMSPKASASDPAASTIQTINAKATGGKKNSGNGRAEVITTVEEIGFHWREVEAEDYKEYIAKLRGIKCPEATIRDIIVADIDKLFEPRFAAVRETNLYQPEKYWVSDMYGVRNRKRDPEKAAQTKALTEERAALIKELLGVEEGELRQANNTYEDPTKKFLDFLTTEQQDRIKELGKKFNTERQKIYESGYIDAEGQMELAALRRKEMEEMKSFMTPEQIFEYDIRTSDTARNMKYNEARGLDLTEAEFRAMFAAKRAEEDARAMRTEKMTPEQMKASQEAAKLAQENLKTALGEERYKEIQLAQDYSYRQLVSAAPFLGFEKAAAMRVADLKTEAEKAANDLRRNQSLTPEERTKALLDIRKAAEAAVTKEIGEKGYNYYKRQGGYWLNNLSPRTMPAGFQ